MIVHVFFGLNFRLRSHSADDVKEFYAVLLLCDLSDLSNFSRGIDVRAVINPIHWNSIPTQDL